MKMKINYERLRVISNTTQQKADEMKVTREGIEENISFLPNYLSKKESDRFIGNTSSYIEDIKNIEQDIRVLGNLIRKICSNYKDKNESFKLDIAKGDEDLRG